jgi:hypothetical protein
MTSAPGRVVPTPAAKDIVVSNEAGASLRESLLLDADCERVIYGARTHHGQILLSATDDQLDELLGYLAAEANHETNRRRQQRLDAAYNELSNAARRTATPTTASRDEADTRGGGPGAGSAPTPARTGVPDLDVARCCGARVPEAARHQVRVECEIGARHLTIVERRPPWRDGIGPDWTSLPVARLRSAKTARPGRCTGAIATSSSTSTTGCHHPRTSTNCSPRSTATRPASSATDQNGRLRLTLARKAMRGHAGPCGAMRGHAGPCGAMRGHAGPCGAMAGWAMPKPDLETPELLTW